jgi:hypothetical protein
LTAWQRAHIVETLIDCGVAHGIRIVQVAAHHLAVRVVQRRVVQTIRLHEAVILGTAVRFQSNHFQLVAVVVRRLDSNEIRVHYGNGVGILLGKQLLLLLLLWL